MYFNLINKIVIYLYEARLTWICPPAKRLREKEMFDKLEDLEKRYEEIQAELADPGVINDQARFKKLMKEQTDLSELIEKYREYKAAKKTIDAFAQELGDQL